MRSGQTATTTNLKEKRCGSPDRASPGCWMIWMSLFGRKLDRSNCFILVLTIGLMVDMYIYIYIHISLGMSQNLWIYHVWKNNHEKHPAMTIWVPSGHHPGTRLPISICSNGDWKRWVHLPNGCRMTAARSDEWDDGAPWVDGCSLRHEAIKVTSKPYIYILVGGWPTPLKNMRSSIGMIIRPKIWKNKKCSKPPTSVYIYMILFNEIS